MNKKITLFMILLSTLSSIAQVKVGDNPNTIDNSSLLELESTSRVLVITRVTNTQMNTIAPLAGAMVYNIDEDCIFQYNGINWTSLCDIENAPTLIDNLDGTYTFTNVLGETVIIDTNAASSPYNNTSSGLGATNVQDAIDEIIANDLDTDPTNELQTFTINGPELTLSNGGGTILLPTSEGPQGPAGADGTNGVDGAVGPAGPQGPAGADGTNGADGAVGPQGPVGPTGATGPQGTQGPIGPQGVPGPEGPQGQTGATGPAGADGADGATGPQGPVGPSNAYTGFFIIDNTTLTDTGTYEQIIDVIPFEPSQVTFVAHPNIGSFDLNEDNALADTPNANSDNNTPLLENSFGTMNGFARAGSPINQAVIFVGGSGSSINNISRYSNDDQCIGLRYTDNDGDNMGVIAAKLTSFESDGFKLDITYTEGTSGNANRQDDILDESVIVLFTAYK